MGNDLLEIPGLGDASAAKLARLGIASQRELLAHLPRRYIDRGRVDKIHAVQDGATATVAGVVERTSVRQSRRPGLYIVEAVVRDETGRIGLAWFFQGPRGRRAARPPVREQQRIIVWGTVRWTPRGPQIQNPEWEELGPGSTVDGKPDGLPPLPVYPSGQGLTQAQLRRWIHWLLDHRPPAEWLSEATRERHNLVPLAEAYERIHRPAHLREIEAGRRRLAFDELFSMQLEMAKAARARRLAKAPVCPAAVLPPEEFAARLPFALTGAQRRAIENCSRMLEAPIATSVLLQGDVGSGKTVVAAYVAARAVLAGYQAAIMAPTRLLAEQHQRSVERLLDPWGIEVDLLVSETPGDVRRKIAGKLDQGEPALVVGTHALLAADVVMPGFAVGVIDEQHRFGVAERERLASKGPGHILMMSATPIPRSLALTLYADLDLIALDEKPPGRKPVDTRWIHPRDRERVYAFVRREVERGRQAYVVFPRVHPGDEQVEGESAATQAEELANTWLAGLRVGLVHGQMRPADQEAVMAAFVAGEVDVLVATTVIEVGVDVPRASVMVVEGADRFGLAQLHQLRGRTGRGPYESYCLLVADPKTDRALRRLDALRKTDDGFVIAELDLELRGPGEITGLRQAGPLEFRAAEFPGDLELLKAAREEARTLLSETSSPGGSAVEGAGGRGGEGAVWCG